MITRGLREIQSLSKFSWQLDTKCSIRKTDIKTFLFEPINERRVFEIILSSGRMGGGGKKYEIYVAAKGGHLFYDLFVQGSGGGGAWPPRHPLDPLL